MTLNDYLSNPFGKGVNIAPSAVIRDSLTEQFRNLKASITLKYYLVNDSIVVCHFKLPSRTKKNVFYDVVFEFDVKGLGDSNCSILGLDFKCFSNCPSFTYTYANAFEDKDMLCKWLKKKYERVVFRKDPSTRNPNRMTGYERSIYICAKYLGQDGLQGRIHNIVNYATHAKYRDIERQILDQDVIEYRYKNSPYVDSIVREKEEKRKELEKKHPVSNGINKRASTVQSTRIISNMSKVKVQKPTGFLSRMRKVKKI